MKPRLDRRLAVLGGLLALVATAANAQPAAPPQGPPTPVAALPTTPGQDGQVIVDRANPGWRGSVSLADLGYAADPQLRGSSSTLGVGFPLPSGMVSGDLALRLQFSPALSPASTVRLVVNERIVATRSVGELRNEPQWTVSVPPTNEPLLSVRLESSLQIGANRCEDLASGNLWVSVGRDSALTFVAVSRRDTIRDFFRFPGGRIVVWGAWGTPQQQAASIGLFGAVRFLTRGLPVEVVLGGGAGFMTLGRSERTVRLREGAEGPAIALEGDTLMVRGDAATLRMLTSPAGGATTLGPSVMSVSAAVNDEPLVTCGPNRVCLSDLGLGNQTVSGAGSLRTSFAFTPASLGGWPTGLEFALNATFDRVPADTLERALLRVWLNGALLETVDVRGRSTLQQNISLPPAIVEPSNLIEVEFVYAPVSGDCQGAPFNFTGQLRSTSSLSWTGLEALPPRIGAVIAADPSKSEVYLVGASEPLARAMAITVGALSAQSRRAITPAPGDPSTFSRSTATLRFVATATPEKLSGLKLALSFTDPVVIRNRQTGRELLRALPGGPLASLELTDGALPTLVLQASPSAEAGSIEAFAHRVTNARRFASLVGSVVVGNASDVVALQFGAGGVEARPERLSWWDRYVVAQRPLWYLLLAVLVIGALYLTWKRLGRRPPVSPPPM